MDRKHIVLASIVVIGLVASLLVLGMPPTDPKDTSTTTTTTTIEEEINRTSLMTLFANSAEIQAEESEGFYLSQEQIIGQNSTVIRVGDVDSTKILDGLKFGCYVEWNDNVGEIWLSLLLRFSIPEKFIYEYQGHQALNLTNIECNVSFYVNMFHNSSFTFKLRAPVWDFEGSAKHPSWWVSKSGSGNQTFMVSTIVNESEHYAPVVQDGEVVIKFSLIVNGVNKYLSQSFVNLATIEIFQLS